MIGLKYIRTTFGDTIITLAEKLGITKVVVSRWENGVKPIPKKRLMQLSEIYSVPEKYFNKELTTSERMMITQIVDGVIDEKDFYIEQTLDRLRNLMYKNPVVAEIIEALFKEKIGIKGGFYWVFKTLQTPYLSHLLRALIGKF